MQNIDQICCRYDETLSIQSNIKQLPVDQFWLTFVVRWLPYRGRMHCFSYLGPGRVAVLER